MQATMAQLQAALDARQLSAAKAAGENGALMMTQLRYAEAAGYYAEAVALTLEQHQALLSDRLTAWAEAAWRGGAYPAALDAVRRALALDEARLPADDAGLGSRLNNLAGMLREVSCYSEAEPLFERALAIMEKALGPEHPTLAARLDKLANLYQATGRHAEAEPLLKRPTTILEKTLPPDHPHLMLARENYAGLLDQLGRHEEATQIRSRRAARRQRSPPPLEVVAIRSGPARPKRRRPSRHQRMGQ